MKLRRKSRLVLEQLEDRLTPASFNLFYSGGALTITQATALSGATNTLNITDNVTPNFIVLTDAGAGGSTSSASTAGVTNVTVNLLTNSAAPTVRTITYDLGAAGRPGNLTLNLNIGAQTLDVNDNGGTGPVNGNFNINAGVGSDSVTTATAGGTLAVANSLAINLASGNQTVSLGNTTIGNNLYITTTNGNDAISLGVDPGDAFSVAGSATVSPGLGNNTLSLGFVGIGTAQIGGNLNASSLNFFNISTGSAVAGNVYLNAGIRSINYAFNNGSSVGGSVTTSSSGSVPLASSSLSFDGAINNNLSVNLGNTPGDSVNASGSVGGNMSITAGSFGKTISLSPTTTVGGNFTASLGNGTTGVNIVSITAGAQIGQNVNVKLGNTTNAGGNQLDLSGAIVGGSLTASGGSGADNYLSSSGGVGGATVIAGSVYINFGPGPNTATISGTVGGPSITFLGGVGNDVVTIDATSFATIYIDLVVAPTGSTKTVNLGVRPRSAFINFGVGSGATKALNLSGSATPINYPLTVLNS